MLGCVVGKCEAKVSVGQRKQDLDTCESKREVWRAAGEVTFYRCHFAEMCVS